MIKGNRYVKSFRDKAKSTLLVPLLLTPPLLIFGVSSLSYAILKKAPFYEDSLKVNNIWIADEARKVSGDKTGEEIYEIRLIKGEKRNIRKGRKEALFLLRRRSPPAPASLPIYVVKANRYWKDEEEKKDVKNKLFKGYEIHGAGLDGLTGRAKGLKKDLLLIFGGFNRMGHIINGIIFLFIVISSLALYLPIIEKFCEFFKKENANAT